MVARVARDEPRRRGIAKPSQADWYARKPPRELLDRRGEGAQWANGRDQAAVRRSRRWSSETRPARGDGEPQEEGEVNHFFKAQKCLQRLDVDSHCADFTATIAHDDAERSPGSAS